MVHYKMVRYKAFQFDREEWGLAVCCLLLATLLGFATYRATRLPTSLSETPPRLPAGLSETQPSLPAGASETRPPLPAGASDTPPPCVPEIAFLRNGFSIRHEGRQIIGTVTRLYVTNDCSFIDIPTAEIDHFEGDSNSKAPVNKK